MNVVNKFLKFIEIDTKLISFMSFTLGISYCFYIYKNVNILQSFVLFISVLLFDMATTAINNHIDKRRENEEPHFSLPISLAIIFILIASSSILGIYLTIIHGLVILVIGLFCFTIGILYSFSPISISKTPYGEIISGVMMGFFITFLIIYINSPEGHIITLNIVDFNMYLYVNLINLLKIVFFTIPTILCTSNIMLANNICDCNRDVIAKRYTLPYYIGINNSLNLFMYLYIISYLCILIMLILSILPLLASISFLTAIPILQNIKKFKEVQLKDKTFILSVFNFLLLTFTISIALIFSTLYNILW